MVAAASLLRLCFIVLFGAMSLLHGPVMTYSGSHAPTASLAPHADHTGHDGPREHGPAATHVACNAFACFLAIEPLPAAIRPPQPILFGVLAAAPASAADPVRAAPDLPPPRLQA
jgi:hypothetical protein